MNKLLKKALLPSFALTMITACEKQDKSQEQHFEKLILEAAAATAQNPTETSDMTGRISDAFKKGKFVLLEENDFMYPPDKGLHIVEILDGENDHSIARLHQIDQKAALLNQNMDTIAFVWRNIENRDYTQNHIHRTDITDFHSDRLLITLYATSSENNLFTHIYSDRKTIQYKNGTSRTTIWNKRPNAELSR